MVEKNGKEEKKISAVPGKRPIPEKIIRLEDILPILARTKHLVIGDITASEDMGKNMQDFRATEETILTSIAMEQEQVRATLGRAYSGDFDYDEEELMDALRVGIRTSAYIAKLTEKVLRSIVDATNIQIVPPQYRDMSIRDQILGITPTAISRLQGDPLLMDTLAEVQCAKIATNGTSPDDELRETRWYYQQEFTGLYFNNRLSPLLEPIILDEQGKPQTTRKVKFHTKQIEITRLTANPTLLKEYLKALAGVKPALQEIGKPIGEYCNRRRAMREKTPEFLEFLTRGELEDPTSAVNIINQNRASRGRVNGEDTVAAALVRHGEGIQGIKNFVNFFGVIHEDMVQYEEDVRSRFMRMYKIAAIRSQTGLRDVRHYIDLSSHLIGVHREMEKTLVDLTSDTCDIWGAGVETVAVRLFSSLADTFSNDGLPIGLAESGFVFVKGDIRGYNAHGEIEGYNQSYVLEGMSRGGTLKEAYIKPFNGKKVGSNVLRVERERVYLPETYEEFPDLAIGRRKLSFSAGDSRISHRKYQNLLDITYSDEALGVPQVDGLTRKITDDIRALLDRSKLSPEHKTNVLGNDFKLVMDYLEGPSEDSVTLANLLIEMQSSPALREALEDSGFSHVSGGLSDENLDSLLDASVANGFKTDIYEKEAEFGEGSYIVSTNRRFALATNEVEERKAVIAYGKSHEKQSDVVEIFYLESVPDDLDKVRKELSAKVNGNGFKARVYYGISPFENPVVVSTDKSVEETLTQRLNRGELLKTNPHYISTTELAVGNDLRTILGVVSHYLTPKPEAPDSVIGDLVDEVPLLDYGSVAPDAEFLDESCLVEVSPGDEDTLDKGTAARAVALIPFDTPSSGPKTAPKLSPHDAARVASGYVGEIVLTEDDLIPDGGE